MKPSEVITNHLTELAGAMCEEADAELSQALRDLIAAAPKLKHLVMRVEEAASAKSCAMCDAAFTVGVRWMRDPACVLLEG